MSYKLKHIGIVSGDVQRSADHQCRALGNQLAARFTGADYDVAYVGSGTDLLLELVGKPYAPTPDAFAGKGAIAYMGLETEDADAACRELQGKGIAPVYGPVDTPLTREFGILDAAGLPVRIFAYKEGCRPGAPGPAREPAENPLSLHHLSMLIKGEDYEAELRFYEELLGFRTVTTYPENPGVVGGFAFLADAFFDGEEHNVMFELICTPDYEKCQRKGIDYSHAGSDPREIIFFEKYGPYYDHYCYTAENGEAAYHKAVEAGALQDPGEAYQPVVEFGCFIAWLKDASGNDIELMDAIKEDDVEELAGDGGVYVIEEK
ncbi:MAG: VOC family protein [Bacillota bacterium]|nr:VOC family protein [Bacillota bacterium]